jgi:D-glycero-alpha-D-manno-heptose-7-phosphate kinase
VVSLADIPSGTGLGSSGAFTVGLLRAIYAFQRKHVTAAALAEEACHIEIDRLHRPVGKQDQYIAAFGGLTCFDFEPDGRVHVSPLMVSTETLHDLESHLVMYFTGYSRGAEQVLDDQRKRSEDGEEEMLDNLRYIRGIGRQIKKALESGDTRRFAELMNDHWEQKKSRTVGMSNDHINAWYEIGMRNGALGGKLVGAGAGGFLLFYAADVDRLRRGNCSGPCSRGTPSTIFRAISCRTVLWPRRTVSPGWRRRSPRCEPRTRSCATLYLS